MFSENKEFDFKQISKSLKTKQYLKGFEAYEIAENFADLDFEQQKLVLSYLTQAKAAKVFVYLDKDVQSEFFSQLKESEQRQILDNLEIDDLREYISEFSLEKQRKILNLLTSSKYLDIKKLLVYDKEKCASIMNLAYVCVNEEMDIKAATDYVLRHTKETDFIDFVYVVDAQNKLKGVINLKDLIKARSQDSLKEIIVYEYHFLKDTMTIKEAIGLFRQYDLLAMPVIDEKQEMLGIITADDILDEIVEQTEKEYLKLQSFQKMDIDTPPFKKFLYRLPWLVVSIVLALLIARFILVFDSIIQKVSILILFQALLLDMAGNIGSQSMGFTIILISKDKLNDRKSVYGHILKEITIAFMNSVLSALFAFAIVFVFVAVGSKYGHFSGFEKHRYLALNMAFCVGISMFMSMVIAAVIGTIIPLLAKKVKISPNDVTGPALTTLNDFLAVSIYLLVATFVF